jgi:hypothetical protein
MYEYVYPCYVQGSEQVIRRQMTQGPLGKRNPRKRSYCNKVYTHTSVLHRELIRRNLSVSGTRATAVANRPVSFGGPQQHDGMDEMSAKGPS